MSDLFPSGPWTGFYTYGNPHDRHRMDLQLRFEDGRMTGSGADDVGFFRIHGSYDAESTDCTWVKTYPGSHDVDYRGWKQGNGICGRWTIGAYGSGGFHIWPKGSGGGASESEREEVPLEEELPVASRPETPENGLQARRR